MLRHTVALVVAIGLAAQANANPVIFTQPTTPINVMGVEGSASFNDDLGEAARVYDDFSMPFDFIVTDAHWVGEYAEIDDFNAIVRAEGFDIRIWSDDGGAPDMELVQYTLSAVDVMETFLDSDAGEGVEFNEYDADLPSGFFGLANVTYWVSIAAILPNSDHNIWDWHDGFGNGTAFQDVDFVMVDGIVESGEARLPVPDVAFSLTFTIIPEPTSILAWLTIGGALACLGRRRLRRAN